MSGAANGAITLPIVIPWLLAIIATAIGAWQFILQQRQANLQLILQQQHANQHPFLQRQLDLCFEASDAASRLAMETDPAEWEKARHTFWRLYWGTLCIVEDPGVATEMFKFGVLLGKVPVNTPLPVTSLQSSSYDLGLKARGLILKSWQIDLPSLKPRRE
jgi:hypothetical protein